MFDAGSSGVSALWEKTTLPSEMRIATTAHLSDSGPTIAATASSIEGVAAVGGASGASRTRGFFCASPIGHEASASAATVSHNRASERDR